jgi:hypothetical protein
MEETSQALVKVPDNPINDLSPESKSFYQFHGVQMIGSEFPTSLIEVLHMKLSEESYDGG